MKHLYNRGLHVWTHWILVGMSLGFLGIGLIVTPLMVSATEPIKVGVILAMTGVGGPAATITLQGANLAVTEINHQGGILGRPLEIIEFDSQSTPIGAQAAAQAAIQQQVAAVMGMTPSSLALVSAPLLQQAGIPAISHQATHPDFTKIGDYIFRVCYTDTYQGQVLAQFARQDLHASTAVVFINTSEAYSTNLAQVFEDAFSQHGGKIVWKGLYRRETLDFQDLLQKIAELRPEITFAPGVTPDSTLILKQAAHLQIQSIFLGGDPWAGIASYSKEGLIVPEQTYFTSHWHPNIVSSVNDHLKSAFRQQYGEDLVTVSIPLMYDAVMLLADAITRAQSAEPQKIRDALAATQNFQGATGTITFDANRNPINKEAVILTYKNGKIELVKSFKP